MANRDFVSSIDVGVSINPDDNRTADTTGTGVDLRGADAAAAIVQYGVITDGGWTAKLQESDSLGSGYTDVAAADQVGTFTEALAASDETTQQVSYIGNKRYIRVFVEETTASTTGAKFSATIVKHDLSREPSDFTVDSSTLVG